MTVGQFEELIGTDRNNRLKGRDLEIVYGLQGKDRLSARRGPVNGDAATILVGGSGGDRYKAANRTTTIVLENGTSSSDVLTARRIGLTRDTSFVGEIDGRHLLLGDILSNQYVIVLDWRKANQQLGKFVLADGRYSYGDMVSNFRNANNYLGDLSWSALQQSGELNLDRVGLSPTAINRAIRKVGRRAKKLERQQERSSRDRLTGIGADEAWVGKHDIDESLQQPQRRQRGDRLQKHSSTPARFADESAIDPFELVSATDAQSLGAGQGRSPSDSLLSDSPAIPMAAVFPETGSGF